MSETTTYFELVLEFRQFPPLEETRPNPIAHSIQKNPAQNKFRMESDGDEGGHRTAEAESRRFGRDGADAGLWRNSSWSVRLHFTLPHAPRVRSVFEQRIAIHHKNRHR